MFLRGLSVLTCTHEGMTNRPCALLFVTSVKEKIKAFYFSRLPTALHSISPDNRWTINRARIFSTTASSYSLILSIKSNIWNMRSDIVHVTSPSCNEERGGGYLGYFIPVSTCWLGFELLRHSLKLLYLIRNRYIRQIERMTLSKRHARCLGDSLADWQFRRKGGCSGPGPVAFGVSACGAWRGAIGSSLNQWLQLEHVWQRLGQMRWKWRWRGFNRQSVGGTRARKLSKLILFCRPQSCTHGENRPLLLNLSKETVCKKSHP